MIEKLNKLLEEGSIVLSTYVNAKTPIEVRCTNGHVRKVTPNNLVQRGNGANCKECLGSTTGKKTTEQFKLELKVLGFEGEVVSEYIGAKDVIKIKCKSGHISNKIPTNMLTRESDRLCSQCGHNLVGPEKLSKEYISTEINRLFPNLTITEYTNTTEPFTVLDAICGHTSSVYWSNIKHKGIYKCNTCYPNVSLQELSVRDYINSIYKGWTVYNDRSILEGKELDIVLPDLGLAFEYNGTYWHSENKVAKDSHFNKTELVEQFGYQLIHISEYDWLNKQNIVKSRILNKVLKIPNKIMARKCELKEIPFPREFLETNHIQGAGSPTRVNYGLFYRNKLVQVMTFSNSRFSSKYTYELVRLCSLCDYSIVGGASKLFKQFTNSYKGSIVSYADRQYSVGTIYEKLGFTLEGNTVLGYYYIKGNIKLSRYQCQKAKLKNLFPNIYSDNFSESEIMKQAGYFKVYNSGNLVYQYTS